MYTVQATEKSGARTALLVSPLEVPAPYYGHSLKMGVHGLPCARYS